MFIEAGRLSSDAEFLGSEGHRLVRFTVASFDQVQPGYNQDPSFIQYKMTMQTQKQEDTLKNLLTQGTMVKLCGEPRQNNYTDKDGNKRYGVDYQAILLRVVYGQGSRKREYVTADTSTNDTSAETSENTDIPAPAEL